ncbi:MAG TPA: DUF4282 domain-containing protein [Gammaproteobacteria bacterium]|nr:DUF4282 domain-containing protein [Gammaproteobacteria bacterium]
MKSFLSFNHFISPSVLIIAYYMGAVLMPLFLWLSRHYLMNKISLFSDFDEIRQQLFSALSTRNKILFITVFIMMFFFMELMWRMMFEVMIGYFQMHDYLQDLTANLEGAGHESL